MGEWLVVQCGVGVISFQKIFGFNGQNSLILKPFTPFNLSSAQMNIV